MITEAKEAQGSAARAMESGGAIPPRAVDTRGSGDVVPPSAVGTGGSGGVVPPRQAQTRLEGLAEVLSHHGLRVSLMAPPGRAPSLHVVNPAASVLAEDVYTGRGRDGAWWFWWSWAERIASGEDLEGAAAMIKQVLAARD
jgi:hypothetical protein